MKAALMKRCVCVFPIILALAACTIAPKPPEVLTASPVTTRPVKPTGETTGPTTTPLSLILETPSKPSPGAAQKTVGPRVNLPLITRDQCKTYTAALSLESSDTTVKTGQPVTVTTILSNQGCLALGIPQVSLKIESEPGQAVFDPANPEPVVHYLAVSPGQSDETAFVLHAVSAGQATITASASFEIHEGYPGPAYWGGASSEKPLVITVLP